MYLQLSRHALAGGDLSGSPEKGAFQEGRKEGAAFLTHPRGFVPGGSDGDSPTGRSMVVRFSFFPLL